MCAVSNAMNRRLMTPWHVIAPQELRRCAATAGGSAACARLGLRCAPRPCAALRSRHAAHRHRHVAPPRRAHPPARARRLARLHQRRHRPTPVPQRTARRVRRRSTAPASGGARCIPATETRSSRQPAAIPPSARAPRGRRQTLQSCRRTGKTRPTGGAAMLERRRATGPCTPTAAGRRARAPRRRRRTKLRTAAAPAEHCASAKAPETPTGARRTAKPRSAKAVRCSGSSFSSRRPMKGTSQPHDNCGCGVPRQRRARNALLLRCAPRSLLPRGAATWRCSTARRGPARRGLAPIGSAVLPKGVSRRS